MSTMELNIRIAVALSINIILCNMVGSCSIQSGASNALATATFGGAPRTTSSCVVNENCNYEIHVIGNYESNGHTGFRIHNTGFTDLYITGNTSRRLILVLSSYEPVEWVLHLPAGIVIDRVIISSFLDNAIVSPPGQVLAVENSLRYFAYSSTRASSLLSYINNRFGAISSFTGTYRADGWRLTIGSLLPNCVPVNPSPTIAPNAEPLSPSMRLVGGSSCQGRLELRAAVSSQLTFGQACDSGFGNNEAMVVCRELGCEAAGAQRVNANEYGFSASIDIYRGFRYVCNGTENSLGSCQSSDSVCTPDITSYAIAVSCGIDDDDDDDGDDNNDAGDVDDNSDGNSDSGACSQGYSRCYGTYCPGSYSFGSTCINEICQCPNNPRRDRCTCLSIIGSCHIRNEADNAVATATFRGSPPRNGYTTYSCVANDNCDNEIHILGNYESNGHTGFRVHNDGFTNVYLSVTGSSSRRLILVLASYEHVQWTLHIPSGVVIDRVIISSYLNSSIVARGQVNAVEDDLQLYAYGPDDGGGHTEELLTNIYNRFGPISSFTGTYQADVWRLNIQRRDPDPDCISGPFQFPTAAPPTQRPSQRPIQTQTPPTTTSLTTMATLLALSEAETHCVQDQIDDSLISNCASTNIASIESVCRSGDCFQTLNQMLTQCGRPNALSLACERVNINSPTSSSSSFSASSLAYALGFGIPLIVVILIFIILYIKHKRLKMSSRSLASQTTASRPSQHFQYSLNGQPALAGTSMNSASAPPPYQHMATTQMVMGLSSTEEPPSYADLEKEKALPPPYSSLQPKGQALQ